MQFFIFPLMALIKVKHLPATLSRDDKRSLGNPISHLGHHILAVAEICQSHSNVKSEIAFVWWLILSPFASGTLWGRSKQAAVKI